MSGNWIKVKIAGSSVKVSAAQDDVSPEEIAQQVTERIAAIGEESDRIDTQGFALRAAYEFAEEVLLLKQEHQADEQALVKALDLIHSKLSDLVEKFPFEG